MVSGSILPLWAVLEGIVNKGRTKPTSLKVVRAYVEKSERSESASKTSVGIQVNDPNTQEYTITGVLIPHHLEYSTVNLNKHYCKYNFQVLFL
jgi:hypothetical protein